MVENFFIQVIRDESCTMFLCISLLQNYVKQRNRKLKKICGMALSFLEAGRWDLSDKGLNASLILLVNVGAKISLDNDNDSFRLVNLEKY